MTLYELTGQYLDLLSILEEETDEQLVHDTLEAIDGEFEEKADGYAKILRELSGRYDMLKAEKERLDQRMKVIDNNKTRLSAYLKSSMIATGKTKFDTDLFKFAIRKNGGLAPLKLDVELCDLPTEFLKVKMEADNDKIREYLKDNKSCAFAHLEERGESLSIK